MKKFISLSAAFVIFILAALPVFAIDKTDYSISISQKGYTNVKISDKLTEKVKLTIKKDNKTYTYNLAGTSSVNFPLQMGSGKYEISVLQNTTGNQYKVIQRSSYDVKIADNLSVYLNSVQNISWNAKSAAVVKAKELVKNAKTDEEKVKIIYGYIINNYKYNYSKLKSLPSTYIPNIDQTYKDKNGICYDFASLFASMLRSVNIPAKLVKGYAKNVTGYHAWNEVYISSAKKWVTIDTTYDLQVKGKIATSIYKDAKQFTKVNEY